MSASIRVPSRPGELLELGAVLADGDGAEWMDHQAPYAQTDPEVFFIERRLARLADAGDDPEKPRAGVSSQSTVYRHAGSNLDGRYG
jgi:hypothetical protein